MEERVERNVSVGAAKEKIQRTEKIEFSKGSENFESQSREKVRQGIMMKKGSMRETA